MNLKPSSNLLWLLLAGDILLILLNIFPVGTELADDLLNLDKEANFAVWYSSTKLFTLAILTWMTSGQLPSLRWPIRFAACVFLCVSISETALLHERLFGAAYTILNGHRPSHGMPGVWIVYFAPVVIALLACVVIFVYRLMRAVAGARSFLTAGLMLWIIALSSEFAPYLFGIDNYASIHPLQLIEESCELLGATAFIGGVIWVLEKSTTETNPA